MNNKLDKLLCKIVRAQQNDVSKLSVIVYVKDINKAIEYFEKLKYRLVKVYKFINAICIEIDVKDLQNIAKTNFVNFVSSQTKVFAQVNVAKDIIGVKTFYENGIYGKEINVAIIDTGISPHLDFLFPSNRIIYFKDFTDKNKTEIYDDNGHGTFIAGLIGANRIVGAKKYAGVAPLCNLIILKALDNDGQSSSVEMLEAMQWIYDNKEKYNIDVVCMSFGAMPTSKLDPLMKGAEKLWDSGIVVVAAAGNSGPEKNTIKSPGVSRKIITVGSIDDERNENGEYQKEKFKIAEFSSRGPAFEFYKPDLVVSGVNLISCGNKTDYTKMSGTSVSAPLVAGVSCLIIQKYNRKITPNQIKTMLQHYCTPIVFDRNSEGFGFLSFNK